MRRALIPLLLLACPALTACAAWRGGGALHIDPLPAELAAPCARPEDFLAAGDWELMAGRLGDALIDCGERHTLTVEADTILRATLGRGAR